MKFKNLVLIITFTLFSGCGYKIVDQNYFNEYRFVDTNVTGDKKIIYLLKNKLNIPNKNASKSIKLDITTNKTKKIKEKNIQNEVTKYEISINASVEFNVIEEDKSGIFIINKNGDFNVSDKYSGTLNNEKNLIKNLVNDISEQILKNLNVKLDDL